jgi:hypothetical protein
MSTASLPLTHYWPWDADAEPGEEGPAACGAPMADARQHSAYPSCPACAAHLAAEDYCMALVDALAEGTAPPLVAEATAAPAQRTLPLSPLGAELFALAVKLNRLQAQTVAKGSRR